MGCEVDEDEGGYDLGNDSWEGRNIKLQTPLKLDEFFYKGIMTAEEVKRGLDKVRQDGKERASDDQDSSWKVRKLSLGDKESKDKR